VRQLGSLERSEALDYRIYKALISEETWQRLLTWISIRVGISVEVLQLFIACAEHRRNALTDMDVICVVLVCFFAKLLVKGFFFCLTAVVKFLGTAYYKKRQDKTAYHVTG